MIDKQSGYQEFSNFLNVIVNLYYHGAHSMTNSQLPYMVRTGVFKYHETATLLEISTWKSVWYAPKFAPLGTMGPNR